MVEKQSNSEPRQSYLPSNSHKGKNEKHIQPVAKGEVHKKPLNKKFSEAFLGDTAENVRSYLIWDVLIPAFKDTVRELVNKGTDAILYGKAKAPANVKRDRGSSYVSYNSISRGRYEARNDPPWRISTEDREPRYNPRAAHDFDDIDFGDRENAEKVLSSLADILMQDGDVTVADFYALSNIESSYTDNEYGWTELGGVRTMRNARGRWYLDLPRPVPLRRE